MFTKTLLAGAALALAASGAVSGAALANPKVKASAAMASPKQPIPYDQLEAYSKATPKQRAAKDWWAGEAATGASTDTSTTLPPASGSMGDAAASTQVNPPTTDAPPSMPTTPPTNTPPDDMMTPNPGSNLPGSDPNLPPKEPK
ncbi:hypothetical protein [Caulobacter endophyticus]|uniref:Uncharacterized protein n=1 Tax=Caulobacter endophyticus TaxID=2172652 RepID=A0A2T9K5W1_9CAUL|nr:hypothetical protein [Caulobacter endophyticus]PVM91366.1 hypothetical protein DDF67_07760 [Caulobacter endophyticus]